MPDDFELKEDAMPGPPKNIPNPRRLVYLSIHIHQFENEGMRADPVSELTSVFEELAEVVNKQGPAGLQGLWIKDQAGQNIGWVDAKFQQ
jgi:hypothetical protein